VTFPGAVRDILGIPVKIDGKVFNHLQEVNEALGSLQNLKAGLKGTLKSQQIKFSGPDLKTINTAIKGVDAHINKINKILDKALEVSKMRG